MKPSIKLMVTGSRHWTDEFLLRAVLNHLAEDYNITLLIHGDAHDGADRFADEWAKDSSIARKPIPPDYKLYGRKVAPVIRNTEGVKLADAVVAFRARGKSNGTDDCMGKAERAGKLWLIVNDWRETS